MQEKSNPVLNAAAICRGSVEQGGIYAPSLITVTSCSKTRTSRTCSPSEGEVPRSRWMPSAR